MTSESHPEFLSLFTVATRLYKIEIHDRGLPRAAAFSKEIRFSSFHNYFISIQFKTNKDTTPLPFNYILFPAQSKQ
jgi:hypothetical protein